MSNLQYRQSIIQEKRKKTPWREFVMEICSWSPMLYHKNKGMISRFPDTVRCPHIVSSMQFNELRDGQLPESDNNNNFLSQFGDLLKKGSLPAMIHLSTNENSDYADMIHTSKNIYLSSEVVLGCENVLYSSIIKENSSNVISSISVFDNSFNIYESKFVMHSTDVFYSTMIINSYRIYNSSNLVGCQYCINCNDLQNQKYCIENNTVTPEEFEKKVKELFFHKPLHQGHNILSKDIDNGNCNYLSKNLSNAYGTYSITNGKNIIYHGGKDPSENIYDMFRGGRSNHIYGSLDSGKFSEHIYNSFFIVTCQNVYYSMFVENCSFCLGCIGLKNKSYCILNKQYTKEERYEKVDEIFSQMERDGTLGDFFPASMNPFYFNDTAAYLIDPTFTKEEVTARGFLRRDDPIKVDIPEGAKIVKTSELDKFEGYRDTNLPSSASGRVHTPYQEGQNIERTIDPDILNYVIQDEQGNVYRIIPMEYKFLVKHGLPLPRKHWLDRMKENFRITHNN